uniref:NADH-ubiquinone oxidoreductase chain 1 n=1 Tax=Orthione mesoamericana TaxID=2480053 RepID=A0A8K1Y3I9_9CRUS|nr:NADH dehydrogenase subunit 1 [Orthione mesoamericana]
MPVIFFMKALILIISVLLNTAFFTLLERKILGYIQTRKGPNKVGFKGFLQPFSDAIKLFTKVSHVPYFGNWVPYIVGPLMALSVSLMLWLVLPLEFSLLGAPLSMVLMFCLMSLAVYPIIAAGWSSNSKYALVGGVRAVAQTISYEVSLILVFVSFILFSGSLGLESLLEEKSSYMFMALPVLSGVWVMCSLAETGRTPFDLPEGESELVSGFNTEYSGGPFAMFFLAEYSSVLFISLVSSILLFHPVGFNLPGLGAAFLGFIIFFIWARGSLPRVRYDTLMQLTWKRFLPVTLAYLYFSLSSLTLLYSGNCNELYSSFSCKPNVLYKL